MFRCSWALACVFLESFSLASAQESAPDLLWFKRYSRGYTVANSVKEVSDGGFVVAGVSGQNDAAKAYLLRLSPSGVAVWDVLLGTRASALGVDIAEDGFVLVGESIDCTRQCVFLALVSHTGEVQWEKGMSTRLVLPERRYSSTGVAVTAASDGGFAFIGQLRVIGEVLRVYVGKTNRRGDLQWERVLWEDDGSFAGCIRGTTDGGYIAASRGSEGRLVLTKLDREGRVSWQRSDGEIGTVSSVQELANGFVVAGTNRVKPTGLRALRTDPAGEVEWQHDFFSENIAFEEIAGMHRLADGQYVGAARGIPRPLDHMSAVLLKGDETGALTWETEFGEDFTSITAFEVTRDGGYVAVGRVATNPWVSDAFVARLSPTGAGRFIRGDSTGDGALNLSDAISSLGHLFGGAAEPDCLQSFDVDDDGEVKLTDPLFLLLHLFQAGPAPPPPARCGVDFTIDALSCEGSRFCRNR